MSITILGEHISIIRTPLVRKPSVPKPVVRVSTRPKTRKFTEEEFRKLKKQLEKKYREEKKKRREMKELCEQRKG